MESGKIYVAPYVSVGAGASVNQSISISARRDFHNKYIRIFTGDYTKLIYFEFMDTGSNENWQNAQWHISLFGNVQNVYPFAFPRLLPRNTEITVKIFSGDPGAVALQIQLLGIEKISIVKATT